MNLSRYKRSNVYYSGSERKLGVIIGKDEYMVKLENFISSRINGVMGLNNQGQLRQCYEHAAQFYK